jgi:hypothetical protein
MRLLVRTNYASVTDRATASMLRATYLEPALAKSPQQVEIDLNGRIRQLSVGAADELVGKFVERLRRQPSEAVVIVRARSWDVLRNVHAALRDRSQAALAMNDEQPGPAIPIGDVSVAERSAFQELLLHPNVDAPNDHLQRLAEKGVLIPTLHGYALPQLEEDAVEVA